MTSKGILGKRKDAPVTRQTGLARGIWPCTRPGKAGPLKRLAGFLIAFGGLACLDAASSAPLDLTPDGFPADLTGLHPNGLPAARRQTTCLIRPMRAVNLTSPVDGLAGNVLVSPGQKVKAGQPLLELDMDLPRSNMLLAEARASADAELKSALVRKRSLVQVERQLAAAAKKDAAMEEAYKEAAFKLALAEIDIRREEQQLRIARLEYEQARLELEKSVIHSPFEGVIGETLVAPGETVGRRLVVATLYVTDPMRVEAVVPAPRLIELLEHKALAVEISDRAGKPVQVTFDYVSPDADIAANTVTVLFKLSGTNVRPGSTCRLVKVEVPDIPPEVRDNK